MIFSLQSQQKPWLQLPHLIGVLGLWEGAQQGMSAQISWGGHDGGDAQEYSVHLMTSSGFSVRMIMTKV